MLDKLIYLTIEDLQTFCKEQNLQKKVKDAKNAKDAMELIEKVLPKGKKVKIDVIRTYRKNLNNPIPPLSMQQIKKIEVFQFFCDEKKINDKIIDIDDNAAIQFIKETFPEEKDFGLETVTTYKKMLKNTSSDINTQIKNLKIEAFKDFCKKNKLNDKIKAISDDNEVWELVKLLLDGNDFSLEIVTAYRAKLEELYEASTTKEKDMVLITQKQSAEIDALKTKNKKLVEDNDSLKNKNELLNEQVKVFNDQKGIKHDFTSKIPSLNDIASSQDKTSVCINKEILVKVTKYVDEHNLVKLENILINGRDLNSAIVQSVLLRFILQNSLL